MLQVSRFEHSLDRQLSDKYCLNQVNHEDAIRLSLPPALEAILVSSSYILNAYSQEKDIGLFIHCVIAESHASLAWLYLAAISSSGTKEERPYVPI